jgi:tetratricopeptide (TPR) repeat protein
MTPWELVRPAYSVTPVCPMNGRIQVSSGSGVHTIVNGVDRLYSLCSSSSSRWIESSTSSLLSVKSADIIIIISMESLSPEAVKDVLRRCDALYAEGKYEESLNLISSPEYQKAPVDLLPYVLEMQIRNMMALLQFQSALKLLDEVLRYLPNLRDFLLRKIECEIALGKLEEALRSMADMSKKMAAEPTAEDQAWQGRVESLKAQVDGRKSRDLTKLRVRFAEDAMALSKAAVNKRCYTFAQSDSHVDVVFKAKTAQTAAQIIVDMLPRQVKVGFETLEAKTFTVELDLFAEILPKESTFDIKDGEVSLQLAKKEKGKHWEELELLEMPKEGADKAGLTHTKKPWNEICRQE